MFQTFCKKCTAWKRTWMCHLTDNEAVPIVISELWLMNCNLVWSRMLSMMLLFFAAAVVAADVVDIDDPTDMILNKAVPGLVTRVDIAVAHAVPVLFVLSIEVVSGVVGLVVVGLVVGMLKLDIFVGAVAALWVAKAVFGLLRSEFLIGVVLRWSMISDIHFLREWSAKRNFCGLCLWGGSILGVFNRQ